MKKLRILLIFSNLVVKIKTTKITAMHNLFANFVKILEVCKYLAKNLVNDKGNIPRPGVVPRFSLSARRERESKRFFRNSTTNSTSCGITQRIG